MATATMQEKIAELRERSGKAMLGGGEDRLEKQHQGGKLTARERVDALVDPGTFEETGLFAEHRSVLFGMAGKSFPADGVVTGAGCVNGRLVHLASQDFTVSGGSAGEVHSVKVAEIMEQSLKTAFQYSVNLGVAGRTKFLAFGGAYHGDTVGALSVGDGGFGTDVFDPLRFPVLRAPSFKP